MHIRLLIDEIVSQTTVLIARVSTAAGVRAPLASLADQVFLDLAKALEDHGVRRTVVADMFGLALRSYQLKVQRLSEASAASMSLWQHLHSELGHGARTRSELVDALRPADASEITTVLNDLVASGLAFVSGKGATAIYGLTSQAALERLTRIEEHQAVVHLVWQLVATGRAATRSEVRAQTHLDPKELDAAIALLLADGRLVEREVAGEPGLVAESLDIPVGAELGWEAAVSDHFRAVTTAIAAKLRTGKATQNDRIGGGTYSFTVHADHPCEARVYRLLQRTREQVEALWDEVAAHNGKHPPPEGSPRVTFYFGQTVTGEEPPDGASTASAADA
jgi:hypothetical protein